MRYHIVIDEESGEPEIHVSLTAPEVDDIFIGLEEHYREHLERLSRKVNKEHLDPIALHRIASNHTWLGMWGAAQSELSAQWWKWIDEEGGEDE